MTETRPLTVIRPPDFIFKYRKPSRVNPSQEVINTQGTFDFMGVKYPSLLSRPDEFFERQGMRKEWFRHPVSFADGKIYVHAELPPVDEDDARMGGQLAVFRDCPFPSKGHPFPEMMYAMNQAKRMTRMLVESFSKADIPFAVLFLFYPERWKIRWLERKMVAYAETCRKILEPYILHPEFMTKYGRELETFIRNFLVKFGISRAVAEDTAEYLAAQVDSDNAYWMRFGDAMATTGKEAMLKDPRKELARVGQVFFDRNPTDPGRGARIRKMFKFLSLALLIPEYRRIFKQCIAESNFENFQFDAADNYHALLYADYNYLGKTLEERMAMYKEYHEKHPPEPPRIMIHPSQ